MALTYKDFKARLRRTIWVAPGEPANLIAAHNIFFNEAMVEIAKWCLLNRQNNTSVINACKTLVRCALTVFDTPPTVDGPGVIRRVYTIANDEWCFPAGTMITTDVGKRPIETIRAGDRVLTRKGLKRVTWSGQTSPNAALMRVTLADGTTLDGTPAHRVWTNLGWKRIDQLCRFHTLLRCEPHVHGLSELNSMGSFIGGIPTPSTLRIEAISVQSGSPFTGRYGGQHTAQFQKDTTSITKTRIPSTTPSEIWNASKQNLIGYFTLPAHQTSSASVSSAVKSSQRMPRTRTQSSVQTSAIRKHGGIQDAMMSNPRAATVATASNTTNTKLASFAPIHVLSVTALNSAPVYDLTVEGEHEFIANGVVVHNCDIVHYEPGSFRDLQCWSQRFRCAFTNPDNAGLPALQQGFKYAEASTDSPVGRARLGMWAVERNRLYVAPWIQSNEKVIVEWDGWKQDWQDDDIVDEVLWGADIQSAIRTYVRWKHEDNFGCDLQKKRDLYVQFYGNGGDVEGELANLMYWDKKKREGEPVEDCIQRRLPTLSETQDDGPPAAVGPTQFAIVGDFGLLGTPQEQVAALIDSWNPEFVITTGDNWYGSEITFADLDLKVGRLYQKWIGEYAGAYGAGATKQNFYPTIGNHDRDPVGRLDISLDFYGFAKLQDLSSSAEIRPFYTVVRGPLQIFVVDAGYDSSQVNQQTKYGVSASSAQAEWLRIALLLSTARWKLVFLHQPPYTSFHTGGTQPTLSGDGFLAYPALRWPFKQWGADAVIGGHIHWYERLEVDGLPYISNGAGGRAVETINGALSPYSKFIYDGDFGAQKCTVDCNTLQMDFYSRLGALQDSFVLTK